MGRGVIRQGKRWDWFPEISRIPSRSIERSHPSLWHDCSSLVTLCSNQSAMSKMAITTGRRYEQQKEQELWDVPLRQIAIRVSFFQKMQSVMDNHQGYNSWWIKQHFTFHCAQQTWYAWIKTGSVRHILVTVQLTVDTRGCNDIPCP